MEKGVVHATTPSLLRAWVILQAIATVIAAPFVLGLFGYGLAHADTSTTSIFLMCFAAAFVLVLATPFALLRRGNGRLLRVLKVIGLLVLIAGLCGLLTLIYGLVIDPRLESRKFEQAMQAIDVSSVVETPELIEGKVAGLRLQVDIRVPLEVPVALTGGRFEERVGSAIWEFIQSPRVGTDRHDSVYSGPGPFVEGSRARISLNGAPVESLPAFKAYFERGFGELILPPGTYRVEKILWFADLRESDQKYPGQKETKLPCIATPDQFTREALQSSDARPLEASLNARFSLGGRRGYRGFHVSRPLKFRFDHAKWQTELQTLSLAQCAKP